MAASEPRARIVLRERSASADPGTATLETLQGAERYERWVFQRVAPAVGQRVLEVGCGLGALTRYLVDRELLVAVDVMDEYVSRLQEEYGNRPNVVVRRLDVSESTDGLTQYGFDSAVSVNVFEHIADDLAAMQAVYRVLRPGGSFGLLVPSHPALLGRFDRKIGHHRRYTKKALRAKLQSAGFRVESVRYSNPVGALGWLINIRLLRQGSLRGSRIFDRLVPVLSRIDGAVEFPFGLSLVAIGRKP
jgi:SAM-dependent methyltransferase